MAAPQDPASLANIPAGKPPPGVIPNHAHPYSDGPVLIGVGGAFTALALVFVATRVYTKLRLVGKWGLDDSTCVIGAVGTVCYYIIAAFCATTGHFGTHVWDLTLADLSDDGFVFGGFFANWTTTIIWPFIKVTFFLMYIQIFRPFIWLRYSSYAGAAVTVLFYFSILVATLAFTVPSPGQTLAQSLQNPRQARASDVTMTIGSVSLALDIFILVLPIAGVSKLQLPLRRKIGVMAVFLTGFVACLASSLALYYRWSFKHNGGDLTFKTMPVILFGLVEMCVGTIASCMPSMSSTFRHLPSLGLWSSKLTSRLSSSWLSVGKRSKGASMNSRPSHHRQKVSEYKNMDQPGSPFEDHSYAMAPTKSIRTFVHTGGPSEVEEDGIHLQYQVEQRSMTDEPGRV